MTHDRFWMAVGRELATVRENLGLTWADVERQGGPAAPTIRENERGKARTVVALTKHSEALGLSLPDVFALVIDKSAGKPTISAHLANVVRRYELTTPQGRLVLRAVADLCPEGGKPIAGGRPARKVTRRGTGESADAR
jgi:hypothetical protein